MRTQNITSFTPLPPGDPIMFCRKLAPDSHFIGSKKLLHVMRHLARSGNAPAYNLVYNLRRTYFGDISR